MSTVTPEEKAKKRANRLRKRRKALVREMRKDISALRKLLYGSKASTK